VNVLVLNCGSSSLKFQVIATDPETMEKMADRVLARGTIERIGSEALLTLAAGDGARVRSTEPLRDHRAALEAVLRWLIGGAVPGLSSAADVHAVGHRVVHGGERLTAPTRLDDEAIRAIEACIELAPLHNPANLKGIEAARATFGPGVPQVGVFDTAFHATMPETSYLYALPYSTYVRHRVRRYGFHGTSHRYVAWRYRRLAGRSREQTNVVSLHLGNGASSCAIRGGVSLDTSMGMTPLEGLVMGTRSGDLDPGIFEYLHHKEGMSFDELDAMLNKQSGLLGISGLTGDMRELLAEEKEHGDRRARLAIDLFCLRVRKSIGAMLARMDGADAILFTGGIGENAAAVRARILEGLGWFGVALDAARNEATVGGREGEIGAAGARLRVFVIPTNEELIIARDTVRTVVGEEAHPGSR
jgi:acetate kinase